MKEILLSDGNISLIDDENFELLSSYSWGTVKNKGGYIYAARSTRKKGKYSKILMHRLIMKNPTGIMVDHKNGNTLDNRKENLRIVDRSKNLQNSRLREDSNCNYKGVSKRVSTAGTIRYNARIQINTNKRLYLGWFKTEIEAAKAYDNAALKYFGEFANLNFKE